MRTWVLLCGLTTGVIVCGFVRNGDKRDSLEQNTRFSAGQLATSFFEVKSNGVEDVEHVVAHAAATPRAVMFINFDWAIMEPQRTHFAEFVIEWERLHPDQVVWFHYVDATPVTHKRYKPLRDLPGWPQLEEASGVGSHIHGWGEVVWLKDGYALKVAGIEDYESAGKLVEQTEKLFFGQQ